MDHPDALVIVVDGAVEATNASGTRVSLHTPAGNHSACWCNEAALLKEPRAAAPPIAAESPTIVVLCPPRWLISG